MKFLVLVALAFTMGCFFPGRHLEPPVFGRGGESPGRATPAAPTGGRADAGEVAQKEVGGREAPASLISIDGWTCLVTEKRFRETAVGERVWCAWRRR